MKRRSAPAESVLDSGMLRNDGQKPLAFPALSALPPHFPAIAVLSETTDSGIVRAAKESGNRHPRALIRKGRESFRGEKSCSGMQG